MRIERALPERDTLPISRLIEICRVERRTVLNGFTPEEERAYLEAMGPREQVFVAHMVITFQYMNGKIKTCFL